jgi:hypothetical protein
MAGVKEAPPDFLSFLERTDVGGAISAFIVDGRGKILAAHGEPATSTFLMPNRPLETGELIVVAGLASGLLAFAVFPASMLPEAARIIVRSAAFHRLH